MTKDIKDFWSHFQSGIEVAVAGQMPDKLFGVRDGFLRFLRDGIGRSVPVAVVPQPQEEAKTALPLADLDILRLARRRALQEEERLGDTYDFYVGCEMGLLTLQVDDEARHFVRSWTVIRGLGDEAWGSSGSVQLPERLIQGLDDEQIPFAIPGTRRRGGMVSSLTGGLENRRSATTLATLNALASLMFGLFERRPGPVTGS